MLAEFTSQDLKRLLAHGVIVFWPCYDLGRQGPVRRVTFGLPFEAASRITIIWPQGDLVIAICEQYELRIDDINPSSPSNGAPLLLWVPSFLWLQITWKVLVSMDTIPHRGNYRLKGSDFNFFGDALAGAFVLLPPLPSRVHLSHAYGMSHCA